MGYDHVDMLNFCYQINKKRKWWHKIFFHFVDIAVCNSFVLFRRENQSVQIMLTDYRLPIEAGLIELPNQKTKGKNITNSHQYV